MTKEGISILPEDESLRRQLKSGLVFAVDILPKVMFNILIKAEALSTSMQIDQRPEYDLLFMNEYLDSLMSREPNYQTIIERLVAALATVVALFSPVEQQRLLDLCFRYCYAFHHLKATSCQKIMTTVLNKLEKSVQFSMTQELILFMCILQKMGWTQTIETIMRECPWVEKIMK